MHAWIFIIACSRKSNVEIWMGSRRDGWTSYIVCAGFGLTVSGYSTTWLPQIVPRTFLRYFATFVIATRVRPHTRGLFNKESKRQKFDWETGGTGRTSCYHGAGFGCLFRGSLPCLIPFSRSPRFSFFSLIRRMTVKLLWIISLSVQIKCYSHGWSVCCFR